MNRHYIVTTERKVVGSPTRLRLRALKGPIADVDVEFAISFPQVVRRMEPPLPELPIRASPVLWVDQKFRITLFFAVLEFRDDADQLAIVMIAMELSVPSGPDRNIQYDGSRRARNADDTRLGSRVERSGCAKCNHDNVSNA